MEKMIAYCGLICTECPGFLATQADDDAQRAKVAEMWSQKYGGQAKPEDINCDGCLSEDGPHIGHCDVCEIRRCARERGAANCARCAEYACETLEAFFGQVGQAKAALEEIRAGL